MSNAPNSSQCAQQHLRSVIEYTNLKCRQCIQQSFSKIRSQVLLACLTHKTHAHTIESKHHSRCPLQCVVQRALAPIPKGRDLVQRRLHEVLNRCKHKWTEFEALWTTTAHGWSELEWQQESWTVHCSKKWTLEKSENMCKQLHIMAGLAAWGLSRGCVCSEVGVGD